jgi:AraC-like DNA-binding protein
MLVRRTPRPALRPFVKALWVSGEAPAADAPITRRERVLPTGAAHLAIRLSEQPFATLDDALGPARALGHAVVGGPRATAYVRDVPAGARSVGVQLRPGALRLLTGVPADELTGRHTPLEQLWGAAAVAEARERLLEAGGAEPALDVLEALLEARLPRVRYLHPAVAQALGRLAAHPEVGDVVADSGYSHRRFIAMFRGAVGLTPKLYCRVARLQRALERAARPEVALTELALDAGFCDQPHLNREFRALAGISPGRYRALAPARPHHVPLA